MICIQDFSLSLMLWLTMHTVAGYMLVIQKTTTHHGPELYHAGDELRENRDWGLHTLDTTRDMDKSSEMYGALARPLVYTTFGNHLLHHFFPAVDHSKVTQNVKSSKLIHQISRKCLSCSVLTISCRSWSRCTQHCSRLLLSLEKSLISRRCPSCWWIIMHN